MKNLKNKKPKKISKAELARRNRKVADYIKHRRATDPVYVAKCRAQQLLALRRRVYEQLRLDWESEGVKCPFTLEDVIDSYWQKNNCRY
jgi:hypothetical protein